MTDRWLASLSGKGQAAQFVDAKTRGLVLRVSADGKAKAWTLLYRRKADGKRQRLSLGRYPEIGLAAARTAALEALAAVAKGNDPAGAQRAQRAAAAPVMTLGDLVREYLERTTAKLRSRVEIARRLKVYVLDRHAGTKVEEWHRRDMAMLLDRLKRRADGRGGPAMANRVHDDLKALGAWAVSAGYRDENPMAHLTRPAAAVRRERVLAPGEIKAVFDRLPHADMSEALRRMIRLLFLTACRASEVSELRTAEVDLEAAVIRLPAERVKNARPFTVPLVPEAVSILRAAIDEANDAAQRRARRTHMAPEPIEFVFPSPRGRGPVVGHAIGVGIRRHLAHFGTQPFSAHDIRRTVATGMAEAGVLPHIVEISLNHVSGFKAGVGGTYNRASYEGEHRAALERWAARLSDIRAGRDSVVAIHGRRRK